VDVRGRPDETGGVWAAAVLVDAHLVALKQQSARATRFARALASALLARDTQPREFYARRAAILGRATAALPTRILDSDEQLLVIEGSEALAPDPGQQSPQWPGWRARRRALYAAIGRDGCEEIARQIARSIDESTWAMMEVHPSLLSVPSPRGG